MHLATLIVSKAEQHEQMHKQVVDIQVHADRCQHVIGLTAGKDPMGVKHYQARKDSDRHAAER